MAENQPTPIVQMKGIGKKFGPVRVLENVDFDIYPGEVHVLAGENGAGKSTLIKILSGVHTSYEGEIWFNGQKIAPSSPIEANNIGISVIHQELSLIPSMSVVDNMFLGRTKSKAGIVQDAAQKEQAKKLLENIDININVEELIEDFPISIRQLIEISKALSLNAKVIVMDEPSSALNTQGAEKLFKLIDKLKTQQCGIVYISHRMEEIERLADRITVLRDGKLIDSRLAADMPLPKLINLMVGREINDQIHRETIEFGSEKMLVENVTIHKPGGQGIKLVDDVSFSIKTGEILGIAGLQGSGASELLVGLFGGYERSVARNILLNGKKIENRSPKTSIKNKVALLTNDRKATGLVLPMSITDNVCLAGLRELAKNGWRNQNTEKEAALKLGQRLHFRVPSYETEVENLSGGNQQKVAVAKWLQVFPEVLLLDEPTKGIDVGSKHEIYHLMNELTKTGISIVLITSEMPELLALSDRIIVMHRGKITAEFSKSEANAENVLEAAMGKRSNGQ